jgi:hypothetical protein
MCKGMEIFLDLVLISGNGKSNSLVVGWQDERWHSAANSKANIWGFA